MREDETTEERGAGDDAPEITVRVRAGERYRLGVVIAQGGMGEILGASDEQIGREVAVKRMKERNPSDLAVQRFFREACIQGRLDHPAIVPVHELGVDRDGRAFFTMKLLTGTTLGERIRNGESRQLIVPRTPVPTAGSTSPATCDGSVSQRARGGAITGRSPSCSPDCRMARWCCRYDSPPRRRTKHGSITTSAIQRSGIGSIWCDFPMQTKPAADATRPI